MSPKKRIAVLMALMVCALSSVAVAVNWPILSEYRGPDVLPNGLELKDFSVQCPYNPPNEGTSVNVTYRLKNVSAAPITFSADYGMFVGARFNSTTDANNRDFGHCNKGATLAPGESLVLSSVYKIPRGTAGTWRFWPAFNVGGKWGPFRWHEIVIQVASYYGPLYPTEVPTPPPSDN